MANAAAGIPITRDFRHFKFGFGVGPKGDTECAICFEDLAAGKHTTTHVPCQTTFCEDCMNAHIKVEARTARAQPGLIPRCPFCRRDLEFVPLPAPTPALRRKPSRRTIAVDKRDLDQLEVLWPLASLPVGIPIDIENWPTNARSIAVDGVNSAVVREKWWNRWASGQIIQEAEYFQRQEFQGYFGYEAMPRASRINCGIDRDLSLEEWITFLRSDGNVVPPARAPAPAAPQAQHRRIGRKAAVGKAKTKKGAIVKGMKQIPSSPGRPVKPKTNGRGRTTRSGKGY